MLTNFRDCGKSNNYSVECLFAFYKNEIDWKDKVATIKKV
jgi:hypothetical protein